MVEKKALWWLPSFPWPYRRFDLSDKRNGKDSNAMYCSLFAIFLCIVYRWWVIKRFCNLMTILCVVFVEWFIPCPNIRLMISVCMYNLSNNFMIKYTAYDVYTWSILYVRFIKCYDYFHLFLIVLRVVEDTNQVVQILMLFDIRFSLWQRYMYTMFFEINVLKPMFCACECGFGD